LDYYAVFTPEQHEYDDYFGYGWETITERSCFVDGVLTKQCVGCEWKKTEITPAWGSHSDEVKCVESDADHHTLQCVRCGEIYEENAEHTYINGKCKCGVEQILTVTVNGNGHAFNCDGSQESVQVTVKYGETAQFPIYPSEQDIFGYNLMGANSEPDGSGTAYDANDTTGLSISNVTSDMTVYLQWDIIEYTVKFLSKGGEGEAMPDMKVTVESEDPVPVCTYTKRVTPAKNGTSPARGPTIWKVRRCPALPIGWEKVTIPTTPFIWKPIGLSISIPSLGPSMASCIPLLPVAMARVFGHLSMTAPRATPSPAGVLPLSCPLRI
jgi:hypothetical protein